MPQPPVTAVQGVNHRLIKTLPFNQLLCRQLTNLQRFFLRGAPRRKADSDEEMWLFATPKTKRTPWEWAAFMCRGGGWDGVGKGCPHAALRHKLLGCEPKCVEFYESVAGFWFSKPEGWQTDLGFGVSAHTLDDFKLDFFPPQRSEGSIACPNASPSVRRVNAIILLLPIESEAHRFGINTFDFFFFLNNPTVGCLRKKSPRSRWERADRDASAAGRCVLLHLKTWHNSQDFTHIPASFIFLFFCAKQLWWSLVDVFPTDVCFGYASTCEISCLRNRHPQAAGVWPGVPGE